MSGIDGAMKSAIASQGKPILQASLVEARLESEGLDDEKRQAMSKKVQRMKEDITKEAVLRVSIEPSPPPPSHPPLRTHRPSPWPAPEDVH
jgi:hypothetical protein